MSVSRQYSIWQRREIEDALQDAATVEEYQRVQAIRLRVLFNFNAAEIGGILGLHQASIWRIQSRYHREGAGIFRTAGRGGRRHAHMDIFEEKKLLQPFLQHTRQNGAIKVFDIRQAYESRLGRRVSDSTIYRLLKRHGLDK